MSWSVFLYLTLPLLRATAPGRTSRRRLEPGCSRISRFTASTVSRETGSPLTASRMSPTWRAPHLHEALDLNSWVSRQKLVHFGFTLVGKKFVMHLHVGRYEDIYSKSSILTCLLGWPLLTCLLGWPLLTCLLGWPLLTCLLGWPPWCALWWLLLCQRSGWDLFLDFLRPPWRSRWVRHPGHGIPRQNIHQLIKPFSMSTQYTCWPLF